MKTENLLKDRGSATQSNKGKVECSFVPYNMPENPHK